MESVLADSTNNSSSEKRTRNLEIADELIDKAKINKNDLMPLVQNIYLGNSINASDDLKLLEIDDEKLEYLMNGNSLIIRGNESENAVCCTNNSTFSFKVAEMSNPLLILPKLSLPESIDKSQPRSSQHVEIMFMTNSYFTMQKEKPKLKKLRDLLEMNLYCGKASDQNNSANKYTIRDLLEIIQASENEIYNFLNYIEAFQIDGYWRSLDSKFYSKLMDDFLKVIEEKCFPLDQVPVKEIYADLRGLYSLSILNQLVKYYFTPKPDNFSYYEIKQEKLCHFYAEELLRTTVKMRYAEFQMILKRALPENLNYEFKIETIQDICYVDEPFIYYFNVSDMPDELEKRFKFLFDKRKKWTYEELRAYIKDLCSNDQTEISTALTKYCRPFTHNNIKYYTSRM